jgi:hypothetical protein
LLLLLLPSSSPAPLPVGLLVPLSLLLLPFQLPLPSLPPLLLPYFPSPLSPPPPLLSLLSLSLLRSLLYFLARFGPALDVFFEQWAVHVQVPFVYVVLVPGACWAYSVRGQPRRPWFMLLHSLRVVLWKVPAHLVSPCAGLRLIVVDLHLARVRSCMYTRIPAAPTPGMVL